MNRPGREGVELKEVDPEGLPGYDVRGARLVVMKRTPGHGAHVLPNDILVFLWLREQDYRHHTHNQQTESDRTTMDENNE